MIGWFLVFGEQLHYMCHVEALQHVNQQTRYFTDSDCLLTDIKRLERLQISENVLSRWYTGQQIIQTHHFCSVIMKPQR